jgi:hypothetical protein
MYSARKPAFFHHSCDLLVILVGTLIERLFLPARLGSSQSGGVEGFVEQVNKSTRK